ncbi:uncharacterized protein EMH_0029530 [Eimeria mitis]|uniref:Uncharacterized protein n=1 Tax=Eimeria mitis TaxID=44415 RepID=U6JUI6_9EIME|nr:uncharacterized protein EMH_0029530 [Eimeria mitis]CDJ27188.1 hypothetical protein EMH_0029530 [Eimeria mitis]
MQRESPAAVEAPHSEPSGSAAAQAREESPQAATAEELAVPETGVAISAKGQEEDSSPSSYRITPALLQHRWGVTLYEERDSPEQSESGTELLEEVTAFPPFRFLGELFPGVPDSILRTHPFYRYPESQDAPHCRNFDINVAMSFAATQVNANISLSKCRRLMKKPHLTEGDVGELLFEAERLCGYAMERMAVTYRRGQAMYATETLGTVFLVLDMLYCIAEVLGDRSMKEAWWPHIAARTEVIRYVPPREYSKAGKCGWNSHLARALDAALGYYRRGDRPPPRVVIGLKLALVCEPAERSKFRVKGYQPWRDDAREWKESIERSLAGKK